MSELDELSLRVLRLLSGRPPGSGIERLTLDGESDESVSSVVERLHFDRLVDATLVTHGVATTPDHWAPSALTDKGRRVLASLDAVVCPTCFTPMRALDATARASSGQDVDLDAGGRLFACAVHGEWYLGPNVGYLRRISD